MLGTRTLTALTLTLLASGGSLIRLDLLPGLERGAPSMTFAAQRDAAVEDRAWALLAEATEVCLPLAEASRVSGFAARAIGVEALVIVRELLARAPSSTSREVAIGVAERLRSRCAGERKAPIPARPVFASLDGATPRERRRLISPYLERLNEAASRSAVTELSRTPKADPVSKLLTEPKAEVPTPNAAAAEFERPAPEAAVSEPLASPESMAITVRPASEGYRERVRLWSLVFRRETDRLRRSRRLLQASIDRRSMARSLAACRAFGIELSRLDAEFSGGVPSRSLSVRIRRMVSQYRRGAAECVAGRPASAFAYLSEGDREWRAVAGGAARMLRPRPAASQGPSIRR